MDAKFRPSTAAEAGTLRVLMLEDEAADAALVEQALHKAGIDFTACRATSQAQFGAALASFQPDVVLADCKPPLDGAAALALVRRQCPQVPVIIVSGALGDEAAAALLVAGARDYVLKDRLARLGPAVRRALAEEQGIRARKAAEKALRASELRYRRIFEAAYDGILILDRHTGVIEEVNQHLLELLGLTREQLIGRPLGDTGLFGDAAASATMLHAMRAAGVFRHRNLVLQTKAGARLHVDLVSTAHGFADGRVIQCNLRDVGDRLRAEAATRQLADIVESSSNAIFSTDRRGIIRSWNRSAEKTFGYAAAEALGHSVAMLLPQLGQAALEANLQRVGQGESVLQMEARSTRKDGAHVDLLLDISPTFDGGGTVTGTACIANDVTERKESELKLERSNRTLRTLIAGNAALVHAADEAALYQAMCRAIVEAGGYRMAWIGLAQQDQGKTVQPAASAGADDGFLPAAGITWADTERGQGPTGACIRTGKPQIIRDVATDARTGPWRSEALKRGYASAIGLPLMSGSGPFGALALYSSERNAFDDVEVELLEDLAGEVAYGVTALRSRLQAEQSLRRLEQAMEATVHAIAGTLEKRDPYTAGHQRRVAALCVAIARELKLPDDRIRGLELAASIHDVGKINVPAEILNKPGRLTPLELALVNTHAQSGYDIVKDVQFAWPIAEMIFQHHERMDGSGYPRGLKGDQILPEARIMAVADVVESMASHRPYRPGLGLEVALDQVEQGRGRLYDAEVVDACLRLFRERGFQLPR